MRHELSGITSRNRSQALIRNNQYFIVGKPNTLTLALLNAFRFLTVKSTIQIPQKAGNPHFISTKATQKEKREAKEEEQELIQKEGFDSFPSVPVVFDLGSIIGTRNSSSRIFSCGAAEPLLLQQKSLGDQITEQIDELHGIVGRDRVGDSLVNVERHGGVDKGHDGNLKLLGLEDDGRLSLGVEDDDAIGGLRGSEAELLVARTEPLGAETVGEEASGAPEGVLVGVVEADPLGHLLEDLVKERVGVHEQEAGLLPSHGANEGAGAAERDKGFVRVDDGHAIADAVRVSLEVVGRHAPPQVGVRVQ